MERPKLVEQHGLDAAARQKRKNFLLFEESDEALLGEISQEIGSIAPALSERFYAHLMQFDDTQALLLQEPGRLQRLRGIQERYFQRLLLGNYGEEYFEDRLRVGSAHDRVGLDPQWYLGAYSLYLQMALPAVLTASDDAPDRVQAKLNALIKIIFLDMGLAIDTYIGARTQQLAESKKFLERVLTSMSDGVAVTDKNGCFVEANPKLCEMLGQPREELLGLPTSVMWGEEDDGPVRERMARMLREGGYHDDRELVRKDGRRIPVAFSGAAIPGHDGRTVGYVGLVRDMTERSALLAALEQAKATLEQRVEQRTRELHEAQAQLFQAEKLSAIGQLAAGIAHEVGTPLNVISGRAEYLLEELGDNAPAGQSLRVIVLQIDRITGLIQQLLDFARDRNDEMAPVRVARAVQAISPLLETRLRRQGIRFTVNLEALPEVRGNINRLQQVFLNLLMNAVDAIREARPQGPGTISIEGDADKEFVHVRVRDDGCGIEAPHLQRIFNPFFTTKPVGQGTGLGLSVTYGLIRDMGGTLKVESRVGEGTQFELCLLRADRQLAPGEKPAVA